MFNFMERLSFSKGIKIKDVQVTFFVNAHDREKQETLGKVSLDFPKWNLEFP